MDELREYFNFQRTFNDRSSTYEEQCYLSNEDDRDIVEVLKDYSDT